MVSTGVIVICLSILLPTVMTLKCLLTYTDEDYICRAVGNACVIAKLKNGSFFFGCDHFHLKQNECFTYIETEAEWVNGARIVVCPEANCNTEEKWQNLCGPSSLSNPLAPSSFPLDSQNPSLNPPSASSNPKSETASDQPMFILLALIIGVVCIRH